jgi:dTMP kinase
VKQRLINDTFARLWAAGMVSSTGDWVGITAMAVLVVRIGGDSGGAGPAAAAVTVVMAARLLALLAVGPVVARVVGAARPRTLLVGLDLARMALVAAVPWLGLPGIVVVAAALEATAALWSPTRDAAVPGLVPRDQLARANAATLVASFGTLPLGAALFTVIALVVSRSGVTVPVESVALWFDAVTFAVSALVVSRLDLGTAPARHRDKGPVAAAPSSVRSVLRESRLGRRVIAVSVAFVALGALTSLGPVIVRYDLRAGAAGYGALVTALGLGGLLGIALVAGGLARPALPDDRLDQIVSPGLVVCAAAMAWLSLVDQLWVASVAALVAGVAAGAVWVSAYTLFQRVPIEQRPAVLGAVTVASRASLLTSRIVFPSLAVLLGSWATSWSRLPSGSRMALLCAAVLLLAAAVPARSRTTVGQAAD